jgi:hypothetical protein
LNKFSFSVIKHANFYGVLIWQYHVIERQTLEKTPAVLIMQKSQRTLRLARIVQNRASRTGFALIVVSMLAAR